jgi:hypothetical protein
MKKEFISYEQALELKELGFNEPCFATYDEDIELELQDFEQTYDTFPSHIIAVPLYQQVFRWFREKHKLTHSVRTFFNEEFYYEIYVSFNYEITSDKRNTYEEAELACLNKLIEITKTKQYETSA